MVLIINKYVNETALRVVNELNQCRPPLGLDGSGFYPELSMGNDTDFFRDTKVRYLGYANEVGEAFRPLVSKNLVTMSYKVAGAYVLADTADKSLSMLWREGSIKSMIVGTGDALLWQTLASIIIPGVTINRVVYYTGRALKGRPVPPAVQRFAPVAVGLACIPIIVTPIDRGVSMFMNVTYRMIFGHHH